MTKRLPDFTGNIRDEMGRFKPGCSGNPAGKPRGSLSLKARLKAELKKIPSGQSMSILDVLAKRIARRAVIDLDPRMIKLVRDILGSEFGRAFKGDGKLGHTGQKAKKYEGSRGSGGQLTEPLNGAIVSHAKGRK